MRLGRTIFILGILILAAVSGISWHFPDTSSATTVSGPEVWGIWTASNSPYYLTDNITVPYGKTLVIEPGVKIIMNGSYSIFVGGKLYANGTVYNKIHFAGDVTSTFPQSWPGLQFNDTGSGSLQNCSILNATTGILLNNTKNLIMKNTDFSPRFHR